MSKPSKSLATRITLSAMAMCSVALAGCENNKCAQMGESLDLFKAEVYERLWPEGGAPGGGIDDADAGATAESDDAGSAAVTDDAGSAAVTDDAGSAAVTDDAGSAAVTDDAAAATEEGADATASVSWAGVPCPLGAEVSAYLGLRYHYSIEPNQIGTPLDEGATCLYPIRSAFCTE